jgi:hypothetical protein
LISESASIRDSGVILGCEEANMRTRGVYAAILALGCLPAAARAGSVSGGTDVAGNTPWTIDETWTDGGATLELTVSGTGAPNSDLLAILQKFITTLPSYGWQPAASNTPLPGSDPFTATSNTTDPPASPGTTSGTGSTSSVSSSNSNPPIAPVPEPSGVALAVTGVAGLALAARRRARKG